MNCQPVEQAKISIEVTDDGWWLYTHHKLEYFPFEEHTRLMTRLVEATLEVTPAVVRAYLRKLWDRRIRSVVEGIVDKAHEKSRQNNTPG